MRYLILILLLVSSSCLDSSKRSDSSPPDNTQRDEAPETPEQIPVDTFYVAKQAEGFYFVLERVTSAADEKKWADYFADYEKLGKEIRDGLVAKYNITILFNAKNYARTPLEKFATRSFSVHDDALRVVKEYQKADVFVAYATNIEPKSRFSMRNKANIEMSVSVVSSSEAPFQVHMGILRGLQYLKANHEVHKNMSLLLHGFIAKTMRMRQANKQFIITNPIDSMADIFVNKLDPEYFRFYTFGRINHYQAMNNPGHDWMEKTGDYVADAKFSLRIVDRHGQEVFKLDKGDADKKARYNWFFSTVGFSNTFIAELEYLATLFPGQPEDKGH